jgi:hypothetical protein
MRWGIAVLALCASVAALSAASELPVSLESRAKGAQVVVVATVADVQSAFAVNQFGDQLIVSNVTVQVEETLKGRAAGQVSMAIEGGTVGDITLRVSDMPSMSRGERAVLFLDETPAGAHVPHGRGLGILKLEGADQVGGTNLTLADLRALVRRANAN